MYALLIFPVTKSGTLHNQPHYEQNYVLMFYSALRRVFVASWPPQIRDHYDGDHSPTICRGIYRVGEYVFRVESLEPLGALDDVSKKQKQGKTKCGDAVS